MKNTIITIDGPSGTGKSTVARVVAKKLGFLFLDTGALYRTAALAVDMQHADINNDAICGQIISQIDICFLGGKVLLNRRDITSDIRSNHIRSLASKIAVHPAVRKKLLDVQRSFALKRSLVIEGRDTGSIVFPNADIKLFLDASLQERARRRHLELKTKRMDIAYNKVLKDMGKRDQRDASRVHSPLIIPEHAFVVDTTHMTLDGVIQEVMKIIRERLAD
jgi:cytidylate kinase